MKKLFAVLALFAALPAHATILWAGGEDVDFPTGTYTITATGTYTRAGYARLSLMPSTVSSPRGTPFAGGSVTSAWLHTYLAWGGGITSNTRHFGLGNSTGAAGAGIFVGNTSTQGQAAIWKSNGTTNTLVANEPGTSFVTGTKVDLQVVSFGASATVTLYLNGTQVIPPTPVDLSTTGLSGVDQFQMVYNASCPNYSEIIVADEDTRLMSLVTLAPSAAGDANAWSSTTANPNQYQDINETTIDDAKVAWSSTAGQDAQYKVNALPAGSFVIKAVKLSARMAKAGASIGSVKLGVKTNGSVSVPAASALTTAWATYETLYLTNPVTSANWVQGDLGATFQIDLQSAP